MNDPRVVQAARSVGTLNLAVLWLRSFTSLFGGVWLSLFIVGLLGQTSINLNGGALFAMLAVVGVVAALFATTERARRTLLLDVIEGESGRPDPQDRGA